MTLDLLTAPINDTESLGRALGPLYHFGRDFVPYCDLVLWVRGCEKQELSAIWGFEVVKSIRTVSNLGFRGGKNWTQADSYFGGRSLRAPAWFPKWHDSALLFLIL